MAPGNGTGVVKQGSVQAAKERLQAAQQASGQSTPPQRPPRPKHVPPKLDHIPPAPAQPSQQSQTSTHLPRRSPLGPPPSARKGPSSYYNIPISTVAPIEEESESRKSHGSFASSNVIPSIIGAPPGYSLGGGDADSQSEEEAADRSEDETPPKGGKSEDEKGLVRQASLGKRHKPALTTIKSNDDLKASTPPEIPRSRLAGSGRTSADAAREKTASPGAGSLRSGTGLLDPSSSSSSASSISEKDLEKAMSADTKPTISSVTSRSTLVSGNQTPKTPGSRHTRTGTSDSKASSKLRTPPPSHLADRVGNRRPPRIDVNAVREAESRGSLTSLPELIRRATRLAANLDRGRTVSRLGMDNWFGNDSVEKHVIYRSDGRHSGSMSDILAAFPPPGLVSHAGTPRSHSPFKRHQGPSPPHHQHDPSGRHRGRRCCGMPLWAFLILVLIVFFLVVVAVVVPVVLVVLPRSHPSSTAAASSALLACQQRSACANGGSSILTADGSCGCLCANGFTGARCTASSDAGCTTTDIAGAQNATVGSAIPRLLEGAMSRFNVPLNASLLLGLFSASNVSCSAENALVTFNGLAARSIPNETPEQPLLDTEAAAISLPSTLLAPSPTSTAPNQKRQATDAPSTTTGPAPGAAVTSNGIIYAAPVPTTSARPRASSSPSSPSSSSSPGTNATALDFARTGVLFVLQESRMLDAAVVAQERLQKFFSDAKTSQGVDEGARSVSLGSGVTVDLVGLTVRLANGTVFGGGGTG